MRVIEWILGRKDKTYGASEEIMGLVPLEGEFDLKGIKASFKLLFEDDASKVKEGLLEAKRYFEIFGDRMPKKLLEALEKMLKIAAVSIG